MVRILDFIFLYMCFRSLKLQPFVWKCCLGWNGGNGNNPNSNAKGRMFIENIDNYCQTTMKLLPIGNYIRETKTTMKEVFLGCFMSCELVDLLLDLNIARNLDEAIRIGQELVYRRKILPLQITLDGTPDESMRTSRRHAAVNKSVNVSMVQFKDDNSLFRTNFQEAQVTEWLLESRSSEDRIQQLVKHEKDREIADILTGNSCGLFTPNNWFRVKCAFIVSHWGFETFVLLMIFVSR